MGLDPGALALPACQPHPLGKRCRLEKQMPNLTDELYSQLQGAPLQRISQQLGVEPQQADQAVSAALPMLLGALGRNASQSDGAQ